MGQSTDAILAFGWADDEEGEPLFGEDEDEWPEILLARRGIISPWTRYDDSEENWVEAHREEINAFSAAERALREEFPCDIGSHCSCDYPLPYVYAKDSYTRASRGYVELLGTTIEAEPEWTEQLRAFLVALDLTHPLFDEDPQWFLVSNWC